MEQQSNFRIITLTILILFSMLIGFISAFSQEMAYLLLILFFALAGYLFAKGKLPLWGKSYQEYSWPEIFMLIISSIGIVLVMQLCISVLRKIFVQ